MFSGCIEVKLLGVYEYILVENGLGALAEIQLQKQPPKVFCKKKRLQHRCFPVKFAKFLRTPNLRISANGLFQKAFIVREIL